MRKLGLLVVLGAACDSRAPVARQSAQLLTWATAGAHGARYRFPIPPGFGLGHGVRPASGVRRTELDAARPAGIGLEATAAGPGSFNPNTVVVTPEHDGFGRDTNVEPLTDGELAALHVHLRAQIASATAPVRVTVGRWSAIRTELPEVIMASRPPRRGRHYIVLDGTRSIAIDCLWVADHEAAVSAACDRVVAELERAER